MKIVIKWVLYALVILITPKVINGISITGFEAALVTALIMGLVNAIIRPVVKILALPLTLITLGLFNFVINTSLLFLVAYLSPGFHIQGIISGFLGSLFIAFCSFFVEKV